YHSNRTGGGEGARGQNSADGPGKDRADRGLPAQRRRQGCHRAIFAVRMNEIFLMSQSRPLRSIHRGEGWTPQTIAEHGMPALKSSFYKLDRSADVFNWDAI